MKGDKIVVRKLMIKLVNLEAEQYDRVHGTMNVDNQGGKKITGDVKVEHNDESSIMTGFIHLDNEIQDVVR